MALLCAALLLIGIGAESALARGGDGAAPRKSSHGRCAGAKHRAACLVRIKRQHRGHLRNVKGPHKTAPAAGGTTTPPTAAPAGPPAPAASGDGTEPERGGTPASEAPGRGAGVPSPPAEEPEGEEPPNGGPPAEEPAGEEPPKEEPPAEPPKEEPPAEEPPVEEPPAEEPPVEEPPKEEPPSEPPAGTVLFSDDFNSIPAPHKSAGGWYSQCNPGRMSVVNGAARFEVRPTDIETDTSSPRCELSGGGPDLKAGDDVWVLDRLRVATDDSSSPPWELWDQWHDGGPNGSNFSPPVALFRYGSNIRLINGDGVPVYWMGPATVRGQWNTLLYHLRVGKVGHIEAWWNGMKVTDANADLMNTESLYLKIGINRSKDTSGGGTSIVEHDRLVIATTKAAAES